MLNERQKALWEFLKSGAKKEPTAYWSKEWIAYVLEDHYPRKLESSSKHNSAAYSTLRSDIRELNRSDEITKIIISSKAGYKIATKEEAAKYIKSRYKRDLKSLKLNSKLKEKYGLDGQLDMELNEIKAFVGGANE